MREPLFESRCRIISCPDIEPVLHSANNRGPSGLIVFELEIFEIGVILDPVDIQGDTIYFKGSYHTMNGNPSNLYDEVFGQIVIVDGSLDQEKSTVTCLMHTWA